MANSQLLIDYKSFTPLTTELAQLGQSLVSLSKKLQKAIKSQAIPVTKVTQKTDPEMFTKNFIKTVRQSRLDFKKGNFDNYLKFRKTLDLK